MYLSDAARFRMAGSRVVLESAGFPAVGQIARVKELEVPYER